MNSKLFVVLSILAILLAGSMSAEVFIAGDSDGDGVADSVDVCPAEDASGFDRNGDGCLDTPRGARHTEYWGLADGVVTYVINETGAPGIGDGSDFAALQAGMDAWAALPNTDLTVSYGGTTSQAIASGIDRINLITMVDDSYSFGSSVLAVGVTTSFTVDSLYMGRLYRPGEIVDADMIFNPDKNFTTSGGLGSDLQSVATHEGGHLYGLSHSALKTASMHYVLPQGTQARTLESDDELVYLKAYPDAAALASANVISGTVTIGGTPSDPLPGAIVYAIDTASGDTTASDYTLPDGTYTFFGLPDGNYYISIYPINGSSLVNYMQPGYVNALVETTAVTLFVPEYWDLAESANDNPADKDPVSVAGGSSATADIVSNIDITPPSVLSISPPAGEDSVRVDASILIQFSEPIDAGSVSNNFRLRATTGPNAGSLIGGKAVILNDDSVLAFTPSVPYTFDVVYELTLNTDSTAISDKFGNPMASLFVSSFVSQPEPPLSLSSLAPNKGVVGSTIVINGAGFAMTSGMDTLSVSFNGVSAALSAVAPNRLVVTVPSAATTGPVTVTLGQETSNSLTFTVLSDVEIARGFEVGVANLGSTPNAVTVTPDGGYAYAATEVGASAVIVGPGLPNYLNDISIPVAGGLNDLDVTPDGRRVYGVSRTTREIHVIDSDPNDGALFNQVLATIPARAEASGIVVEPSGRRAYVSTPDSVIQVWDINLESATYRRQVGAIEIPDPNLRGKMAVTPAGGELLVLSGLGNLYVCDLGPDTLLTTVAVGADPYDVTVDPAGQRAYVSDRTGLVTVVRLDNMTYVQDITTGGSGRGLTITPAGQWVYATNLQLDQIDVIDLNENNPTFRSVAATIDQPLDPVDVDVSPDGFYAYSVVRGAQQLVVTAIGLGPYITSMSPRSGNPGHTLVINGGGYDATAMVDFDGTLVSPDRITGTSIIVTVPPQTTSGPVRVEVSDEVPPYTKFSNAVYYRVLGPTPPGGGIRLAARAAPPDGTGLEDAMAISPLGDLALFGGNNGEIYILDIDPSSPTFNQFLDTARPLNCCVRDIAFTPDGRKAFCIGGEDDFVPVLDVNQNSNYFGKPVGHVVSDSIPFIAPSLVKVSPNGEFGLIFDQGTGDLALFDLIEGSPTYLEVIDFIPVPVITDFTFSPDGLFAVVLEAGTPGIWSLILDPFDINYLTLTSNLPFGGTPPPVPVEAGFYPDADSVLVWAVDVLTPDRLLLKFDTRDFNNILPLTTEMGLPATASSGADRERMRISPRGDRMIVDVRGDAFYYYDINYNPVEGLDSWSGLVNAGRLDADFAPDASRFYVASAVTDTVWVFDFTGANTLSFVSGTYQTGVVGSTLPAPLRVRATEGGSQGAAGVPVTFEVQSGGGYFTTNGSNLGAIVVATDDDGYAEADYTLGPAPGTEIIYAIAEGLSGSPMTFVAGAVADPSTLPLQYAEMLPLPGAQDVSVSTSVLVTFSRGVDPTSISDATLYLHTAGDPTPLPVVYGFTDSDRKVSMTPINVLDYNTSYLVEIAAGIVDKNSGPLNNPSSVPFTTGSAPPPKLSSIAPPSGTSLITVVLSGSGFDPVLANNTVLFNGLAAAASGGDVNDLQVKVPAQAASGLVRVAVGSDTSNAVPFNVLVPTTTTVDDVIGTVAVGGAGKTVTVSPDGSIAYTAVPESDIVIPIEADNLRTYESIGVGDNPVAIVMHPEGTYAYVANFGSASLSIIDTDPNSPDFHKVTSTLVVGANPVDVAVMPDGSRVYVANSGSNSLSVVDGDSSSAAHNTVIGTVSVTGGAKTVTVSPDGTTIYVGTDSGIQVLESLGYSVIGTVATTGSAKTVTVSPDGTLLYVVTTEGEVLIVDVEPGSTTQNSVIGTVATTGGTKTVTVSPDGSLAYLVQNDSDEVIVVNVETIGAVSALDDPVILPPKTVNIAFVDTVETGNVPEDVVFDPTGSGVFLVVTSGDQQVTKYGEASKEFAAETRVTPRTLNLQSRGRYVTGWLELDPPATVDVNDIDVSTVMLNDVVPVFPGSEEIVDEDGDGIDELVVKFSRCDFQDVVPQGEYVPVWITGDAGIHTFVGRDTIRTIRPQVVHPKGGEQLIIASAVDILWTSPAGVDIDYVDVHYTLDDGESWNAIAEHIPNAGVFRWTVPVASSGDCRVMVTIYRNGEPIGMGMSPETFSIGMPVAVTVTGFEAVVEDGTAVMRWTTGLQIGTEGFHVLRSESEDGGYQRMTDEMIAATGGATGASYEYRDESVRPNRTYYYELEEVAANGPGSVYGPYELVYRLTFGLEQNTPNPFNPITTIRFSVAEDTHVRLIVYDVAGRRVRTLVDGNRKADVYKVEWDGTNDAGQSVATGMYFYRMTAGKFVQTKKMLLLK
jgi:YVTN family beta-propeller protein